MVPPSLDEEIIGLRSLMGSPRDPDGRAAVPLAEALLIAGHPAEALALVDALRERLPDFGSAHLVAARILEAEGDEAGAERALRTVLRLDPANVAALRQLGGLRELRGEGGGGGALFDQARSIDGDGEGYEGADPEGLAGRGGGHREAAKEGVVSTALEPGPVPAPPVFDPDEEDPLFEEEGVGLVTRTLADLYWAQGLHDRARETYRELIRLDPADGSLRARLREMEGVDAGAGDPAAALSDAEPPVDRYLNELLDWTPAPPSVSQEGEGDGESQGTFPPSDPRPTA